MASVLKLIFVILRFLFLKFIFLGFLGNTTEELCARWHQLGAFYTFVRNHNTIDTFDQDPVALGPRVVKAAIYSLQARYTHLPYLYSLFYKVHIQGGTVLKPLFFEFPDDPVAPSVETQFLWGPALMVAPALEPGQKNVLKPFFKIFYKFLDFVLGFSLFPTRQLVSHQRIS